MKKRSSSVDRICAAAAIHFAERGYDASSLSEIAAAVGIRKASLYTHFESKDALYMEVLSDALRSEQDYAHQCFVSEDREVLPGTHYCNMLIEHYNKSVYLRFLLRSAYLPPKALHTQISAEYEQYLDQMLDDFTGRLLAWKENCTLSDGEVRLFGQAFLGIIDSLHVELLYGGGKRFYARLEAFKQLLRDALGVCGMIIRKSAST
ncbi:MAG: TetR/AcrR family transcriptional regulator [Azovibrio sp.]